jgi:ribosomal protein S18 acetylase RimI-like enzyme
LSREVSEEQNPDSSIVIRPSEAEDRARSTAVRWSVGWVKPPSRHRYWAEAGEEWIEQHYYREFVAEVDGVIAARVGLEAYRQPFAELVDLSVRPDYRRRGLGTLLMRQGQIEAAKRGFAFAFLQTERDNVSAQRLYVSEGYVPTVCSKMLRMIKVLDYPLVSDFLRQHPLAQYRCTRKSQSVSELEWFDYVTDDALKLHLRSGSCISESDGLAPALPHLSWRVQNGLRGLTLTLESEAVRGLDPGNHVELRLVVENTGRQTEEGVFQMIMPEGVRVSSPATNVEQVFGWRAAPGERIEQPVTIQIEPSFDPSVLWYLNYKSLPVSMEAYWGENRALLSTSLHLAAPPPANRLGL